MSRSSTRPTGRSLRACKSTSPSPLTKSLNHVRRPGLTMSLIWTVFQCVRQVSVVLLAGDQVARPGGDHRATTFLSGSRTPFQALSPHRCSSDVELWNSSTELGWSLEQDGTQDAHPACRRGHPFVHLVHCSSGLQHIDYSNLTLAQIPSSSSVLGLNLITTWYVPRRRAQIILVDLVIFLLLRSARSSPRVWPRQRCIQQTPSGVSFLLLGLTPQSTTPSLAFRCRLLRPPVGDRQRLHWRSTETSLSTVTLS